MGTFRVPPEWRFDSSRAKFSTALRMFVVATPCGRCSPRATGRIREAPMLHEFWQNFTHNLFKPLMLFFYFGFLIPILKVRFEFPYVIYQGLTMYLLLAIGWHGGEELAKIDSRIRRVL